MIQHGGRLDSATERLWAQQVTVIDAIEFEEARRDPAVRELHKRADEYAAAHGNACCNGQSKRCREAAR